MLYVLIAVRFIVLLAESLILIRYIWKSSLKNVIAWFCAFICSFAFYMELYSFMNLLEKYSSSSIYSSVYDIVALITPVLVYMPLIRYCKGKENSSFSNEIILLSTSLIVFVDVICRVVGDEAGLVAAVVNALMITAFALFSEQRFDRNIAKVNEQMLNAQLNHYETVKQSNFELRRIKHDMKNHLLVARDMADKGRTNELIAYIDELIGQVAQSEVFCRTGNDIADAILTDKNNKAAKRNISLQVSGDLAGVEISAVDLCTIIANLLDNAIEAVSKLYNHNPSERHKVIKIDFKKNSNFLVIEQSNYALDKIVTDKGRFITSKKSPDHGFGIHNIKDAVARNNGEFDYSCQDGEFVKCVFEIILPIK